MRPSVSNLPGSEGLSLAPHRVPIKTSTSRRIPPFERRPVSTALSSPLAWGSLSDSFTHLFPHMPSHHKVPTPGSVPTSPWRCNELSADGLSFVGPARETPSDSGPMGQNASTLQAAPTTAGSPSLSKHNGLPRVESGSTTPKHPGTSTPTPRALGKRLEVSRSVVKRQGAPESLPNGRLVVTPEARSKLSPITLDGLNKAAHEGLEINKDQDEVECLNDRIGHSIPCEPALASVQELASSNYPSRPSPISHWSTSTIGDGDFDSRKSVRSTQLIPKSSHKTKLPSPPLSTHSTRSPLVDSPSVAKKLGRHLTNGLKFRQESPPSPRIKGPIVIVGGSRMSDRRYSALSKRSNGSTSAAPTIRTATDKNVTLGAYSEMFGGLDEEDTAGENFIGVSLSSGTQTPSDSFEHSPRLDHAVTKGPRASAPASYYGFSAPSSSNGDDNSLRAPRISQPHLLDFRHRQNNSVVSAASRASSRRSFLDSLTRLMEDAAELLDVSVDDEADAPPLPPKWEGSSQRPSLQVITNEVIGNSSSRATSLGRARSTRSLRIGLARRPSMVSQTSFPRSVSGDVVGERPTSQVSQSASSELGVPVWLPKELDLDAEISWGPYSMQPAEAPVGTMSPNGQAAQQFPTVASISAASTSPARAPFVPRSLQLSKSRPQSRKSVQSNASTPSMSSSSSSIKTTPQVVHEIHFPTRDVDATLDNPSKTLQSFGHTKDYSALPLAASAVDFESAPPIDILGPMEHVIDSPTIVTPPVVPLSTAVANLKTPTFAHFCLKPAQVTQEAAAPDSPARLSPMTMLRDGSGVSSTHSTPEQRRQGFLSFLHLEASAEEGAQQYPVLVNRFDGVDQGSFRPRYYSAEALAKPMHDFEREEFERRESVPRWTRPMIGNAASGHDLRAHQAAWDSLASGGAEADKSRNTLDGKLRLGKGSKRGFDRGEIKGWLQEQAL
ncbi:BZ3500_MvSof-1268-A1-R1_Chr9g10439 [Microbotryum saponariae]|uniref:BZ3500_MvSof-1268-A1-R1_Chr9g10439 protein n=1 Tax=Microbotryum saponariae TaxID=289078 RepID=A0A2X0KDE1_9BASI|nr:BZ3501_MvSof-1269-A2-R1_Chr9g10189 [Microbotryum saponariae]SDA00094.1 BZ3500_MvSof-1268-A1-R1_Chr9g10439 [Microbotryum saponariae]